MVAAYMARAESMNTPKSKAGDDDLQPGSEPKE
jgi:hypothetical protein